MNDRNQRSTKAVIKDGKRLTPVSGLPASSRVESPPCMACHSQSTFIYATRQIARYCKCRHCGHTWTIGPGVGRVDDIQTR